MYFRTQTTPEMSNSAHASDVMSYDAWTRKRARPIGLALSRHVAVSLVLGPRSFVLAVFAVWSLRSLVLLSSSPHVAAGSCILRFHLDFPVTNCLIRGLRIRGLWSVFPWSMVLGPWLPVRVTVVSRAANGKLVCALCVSSTQSFIAGCRAEVRVPDPRRHRCRWRRRVCDVRGWRRRPVRDRRPHQWRCH